MRAGVTGMGRQADVRRVGTGGEARIERERETGRFCWHAQANERGLWLFTAYGTTGAGMPGAGERAAETLAVCEVKQACSRRRIWAQREPVL